jgi:thiol-disulfide isomerase/thioredoxin
MVADRRVLLRLLSVGVVLAALGLLSDVQERRNRTLRITPTATMHPIIVAPTLAPTLIPALTFIPPTPEPTEVARELAPYPVYGPGAEIRNDIWLNSDVSLRLADLRGRVVLLEFWAFGCIPCLPVLSNVHEWYDAYRDDGLTVIGIHYPKVEAEHSYDDLVAALDRLDITYPVAQDNEGTTWRAYGQQVWPTLSLIDKRGNLRYQQVGAGGYEDMETAIRALLEEDA